MEFVRSFRGCDAPSVLYSVGDSRHPNYLRWVFNLAVREDSRARRQLRFWKEEVMHPDAVDKDARPETVIGRILGERLTFCRSEIEVQWTLDGMTLTRLVRRHQIVQQGYKITRASLAAFLMRRLQ